MSTILNAEGGKLENRVPKVKAVHPFGSKVLVEVLNPDEVMNTNLVINEGAETGDAPQAYIVELGPNVSGDVGLAVGQRIYWEGKGMAINDPRAEERGRVFALLEISNIKAVIEEQK